MTDFIGGFTEVNGYLWPIEDRDCRAVTFDSVKDLERVYPYVTDWSCCIQAGGNCGVWPNALAKKFDTVYTFEPDPDNFRCLVHNVRGKNVIKLQAGLGMGDESPTDMFREKDNCGAYQLNGAPGAIPVISIDSLNLPKCGLIYLDIEGYEPFALQGAKKTIARCRPVIALESKGLETCYGINRTFTDQWLTQGGYKLKAAFARDVVYVPC